MICKTTSLEELKEKYPMIRSDTIEGIRGHVVEGIPTGSFLYAVLCNNLKESFGQADDGNRAVLFDIVRFCYWEIPCDCWGSPEEVKEWQKARQEEQKKETDNDS